MSAVRGCNLRGRGRRKRRRRNEAETAKKSWSTEHRTAWSMSVNTKTFHHIISGIWNVYENHVRSKNTNSIANMIILHYALPFRAPFVNHLYNDNTLLSTATNLSSASSTIVFALQHTNRSGRTSTHPSSSTSLLRAQSKYTSSASCPHPIE